MALLIRFRTECIDNEFQLGQIFFWFFFFSFTFLQLSVQATNDFTGTTQWQKIVLEITFSWFIFLFKIYFLPSRSTTATTFSWFPSDSLQRIFHCDGDRFCTEHTPKRIKEKERAHDTRLWCSCLLCSSADAAGVDADKNHLAVLCSRFCVLRFILLALVSVRIELVWLRAFSTTKNPISQHKRMGSNARESHTDTCKYIHVAHGAHSENENGVGFLHIALRKSVCAMYVCCCCCCLGSGCGWGRPIEIEEISFMQSHRFSHSVWTNEAEVSSHRYRHSVRFTYFLSK